MKCVFKNNACKEELKTSCSDYNNSYYYNLNYKGERCYNIQLTDTNKYCNFYNDSCSEQFKKCEYYKGNNKTECESIFPFNRSDICLFINNECIQIQKNSCSQYRPEEGVYGCEGIKLDNYKKYCVLVNNRCEEHYKYCRDIELDKRFTFIYNKCQEPETHCPFNETMREVCLHNVDRDGINCRIEYGSSSASYQIENGKTICSYSWIEDYYDGIRYISYCGHYTKYIDSKKCTSIIPSNNKKKFYFNFVIIHVLKKINHV